MHFSTIAELNAASVAEQCAYYTELIVGWQDNFERQLDDDYCFDARADRGWWQ